jgi:hypothetical protein
MPLAVVHMETGNVRLIPFEGEVRYPANKSLDLAFLPNAAASVDTLKVWPMLDPEYVTMGLDVYAFGYTARGNPYPLECGYHSGSTVVVRRADKSMGGYPAVVLSLAVLEGMSGCALQTVDHPGLTRAVVGICCGNESRRILAQEVVQATSEKGEYREEVHRLVEHGLALPVQTISAFFDELGIAADAYRTG